jgi:hypothetical protein
LRSLIGVSHPHPSPFAIITGRRSMTKKKAHLTPQQKTAIREAVRLVRAKMTRDGERPPVTLPKLKFMEKKDGDLG